MESNEQQLRVIQRQFLSTLPERIEELGSVWRHTCDDGLDQASLKKLHRMAHTLAGEGAMLGFYWLSGAAEKTELFLRDLLDAGDCPPGAVERLSAMIHSLQDGAQQHASDPLPSLPANLLVDESECRRRRVDNTVLIVDDDVELSKSVALLLEHFGYRVELAHSLEELRELLGQLQPSVLVMDIVLPEGSMAGIEFVSELGKPKDEPPHVIFTSRRNDMEARLHAMRAGGCAYLTKPIDINNLVERIDSLTGHTFDAPYEVFIVDDDPTQANFHAQTLRAVGVHVTVITRPLEILERLQEVTPDLILLDVYMPECDGPELAAVLRQHESYLSIPIVFLSSEDDLDRQVDALHFGGDDFLTKPIEARHLLSMAIPRAQRGRALGSLLNHDGLTGLVSHTKHKERLESELLQAIQRESKLAYAMLDLDGFKAINDQFGHSCGDRVLRSLARFLRSRLRRSDIVGRCGGDEFGVILPETDASGAAALLDGVREAFSQVKHRLEDRVFHATISVGVSVFPSYDRAERLIDAADKALYEAKHKGRNRLVVLS